MKLLIVDDSAENRRYLELLLRGMGYTVAEAAGGQEALEKLRSDKFELVISDIMMPGMDGFQLLQECKKDPGLSKIPFIFITGIYLDQEDENLAYKLGVRAFLRKPVEPPDIIRAIEEAMTGPPARAKRGRKPKSTGSTQEERLLEKRLSTKLARKIEELENATANRQKAEFALQEKEEQYRLLFETMLQGVIYHDAEGRVISANPAALHITGLTVEQITGRTLTDPRWRMIREDGSDFPCQEHPVTIALRTGQAVKNVLLGIYNPAEQKYRWCNIDAIPLIKPEADRAPLVYTTITDVTEDLFARKAVAESEARLHAILENTDAAIFALDRDFRLIAANTVFRKRFEESTGRRLIEGMDIRAVLHKERQLFWEDLAGRVLKGERPTEVVHYNLTSGSYDVEFSAYPIVTASGYITGFSFFGHDITERNRAAENIRKASRLFKMLFLCNEAVVHARSEEDLLKQICRLLVDTGGYKMAWVGEALHDEAKTIKPVAYYGTDESYINTINGSWADTERGQGPAGKAIRSGQTIVLQDISRDPDYEPWYAGAASRGYIGKVALPLKINDEVYGVLNVYVPKPDLFADEEITLLKQLAEDVSYGLGSLRMLKQMQSNEAYLRESEERFRIASQSTSDLVWDWDIASGKVDWSGKIDEMLGYAPGEFPRTLEAWEKALHPEDHDRVMEALNYHARTGEPYEAEYRIIQKNGSIRHWIDRGLVLRDSQGQIKRSIGACIDITERRQSQERSVIRRELALKIAASSDLNYALRESLQAAVKLAGCNSGVIYMLNEKGSAFILSAHTGLPDRLISKLGSLKRDSYYFKLIMEEKTQYITAEMLDTDLEELLHQEDINFIYLVHIHYRGSIIGCLGICSHNPKNLNEIEKNSLDTIAADIESMIERIYSIRELEKSEERYRFIAEHTDDVIWVMDKYLHYTYFSPAVIRQRGFTPEEMLTLPLDKVVTPDSLDKLGKLLETKLVPVMQGEIPEVKTLVTELEAYRKDGSTLWSETSMTLLLDREGNFNGLLGISRDITERKKAEDALRESEEKYRTVLDEMNEAYYEIDARGNYTFFNDTLCRHLGYTREELMGMNYKVYTPPEDYSRVVAIFSKVFNTGMPARNVHLVHITRDGQRKHIENSISAIRDREGKITGIRGLGHDITDRIKSEEELQKRALLLDAAYDSIIAFDPAGNIVYANETAANIRGYSIEEMLSLNIRQLVPPENIPLLEQRLEMIGQTGELTFEVIHLAKDGHPLELEARVRAVNVNGERLNIAVYRDITQRNKMQKELLESEQRYRSLFENNPVAVYMQDINGRFISVNDATCRITGYSREEILSLSPEQVIVPEDLEKGREYFIRAMRGDPQTYEQTIIGKDGRYIQINVTNIAVKVNKRIVGVYSVSEDITERKKAEKDLKNALEMVNTTLKDTIDAIAVMSELRDRYTAGHQRMVTQLAVAIAGELGLSDEQITGLRVAGLLHDLGKVYVPSEILSKPGKLSTLERNLAMAHAEAGYEIVRTIKFPWPIAAIIRQHHERMDGSGYPHGLKGEEIILEARILAVADVVEAMMSHRPYRPALGIDLALEEINSKKNILYYGPAVEACIILFREKGFVFTE